MRRYRQDQIHSGISRSALKSVPLRNEIENADLQVIYQPEGVSLRFITQPEANADGFQASNLLRFAFLVTITVRLYEASSCIIFTE